MSKKTPTILLLDHNPRNVELMEQFLHKEDFETTSATTIDAFTKILRDSIGSPHALGAILDLTGFDRAIWGPIEELHARGIPFLIISTGSENRSIAQQEGAKRGAAGVLMKPLVMKDLLRVIKTLVNPTA